MRQTLNVQRSTATAQRDQAAPPVLELRVRRSTFSGGRYFTSIRRFWSASISAEAEYRANFVLALCTSLINLCGSLFGLFLFYRTGYQPGGWRWEEALIVLGIYTLLDSFAGAFLAPNLNRIVTYIQEGGLDFVLLKPIDTQFWLSTRYISLWGFPNFLFGTIILGYAAHKLQLGPLALAHGLLFLVPALVILYSLWFLLGTLSIWFVKIYNVTAVLRSVLEAGRFPLNAYPRGFQLFFTFVIPVAFLTTVPAEAIIGRFQVAWLVAASALAAVLLLASRLFWRFALRFYTSASS